MFRILIILKQIKKCNQQRQNSHFTAAIALSDENRKKCIQSLKKAPSIKIDPKSSSTREERHAAVLVPICINDNEEISLLYTRRSGIISRHVRQVAFPGGIKDDTDSSYEDCALRETEEEIGLDRSRIEIWGNGNLFRPPRTAAIMPVIGTIKNLSINELKLNKHEVDEAFMIPIKALCSIECRKHTQFKPGYSAPVYIVGKHRIWGITAAITDMFLGCLLPKDIYTHSVEFVRPFKNS